MHWADEAWFTVVGEQEMEQAGQPFNTDEKSTVYVLVWNALNSAMEVPGPPICSENILKRIYRAETDGKLIMLSSAIFGKVPEATGLPQLPGSLLTYSS